MVLGPALADDVVLEVAARLHGEQWEPAPRDGATAQLVVVGHHLAGQPRNGELTDRGGVLLETTSTGPDYRLLRVDGDRPVPALLRSPGAGAPIEVELWQLPVGELPGFLAGLPEFLALGRVQLADGRTVPGLVGDASVPARPVADITESGGWRRYLARPPTPADDVPPRVLPTP
jgi:allophanate hydrolase